MFTQFIPLKLANTLSSGVFTSPDKGFRRKTGSEIIISLIKQIQAFPAGKITTPVFSIFLKFG